jgi:hypothetical protein
VGFTADGRPIESALATITNHMIGSLVSYVNNIDAVIDDVNSSINNVLNGVSSPNIAIAVPADLGNASTGAGSIQN